MTPEMTHRHLVIAGAQRCGTTYLRELLAAHPEISMAEPARPEPKAFLRDIDHRAYDETFFAHAREGNLLGDKSTSYLDAPDAAERIDATLGPQTKVIVQLRDPVARAVSHWAFSTQHGLETRPLDHALRENLAGPTPWDPSLTSTSPFGYLEGGSYADKLEPWLAIFGDRLRVTFLDELLSDPSPMLRWLGVAPTVNAPDGVVNASCVDVPELDRALQDRLRTHFAPADRRLAALLDRPLPWPNEGARWTP